MADDMRDQESTETGQAPTLRGQAPQSNQLDEAAGAQQDQGSEERYDAEYVRRLRAENAAYRKRMRELEQTIKAYDEERLSESERQRKRISEMERDAELARQEAQELRLRLHVERQARRLGIVDEEAALALLDRSALEYDDRGNPTNLEAALRNLLKAKPYLAQVGNISAGSPMNPARPHTSLNIEDIKRMSPEEINRRWDEVQQVLANSR